MSFDLLADRPVDAETRTDPWPMTTLVSEHEGNVLEWATVVNEDKLVLCYMKDVKNVMDAHNLSTGAFLYNIPIDVGSVTGFSGQSWDTEMFFTFSSMVVPSTIYRLDLTQEKPEPKV